MFAIDFEKYINKLDQATVREETDVIREAYSNTPEGIAVQRILGNFWEHEHVYTNLPAIVKILTDISTNQTSFVSNRFVLLVQLRKNPKLTSLERTLVESRIENICSFIRDSVGVLLTCAEGSNRHKWLTDLQREDLNGSVTSYLTLGLYNKHYNLAAYLFINSIAPLTLNFDCFARHPVIKGAFELGVLRAINRTTVPVNVIEWLCEAYPDVAGISIHRKLI